MPQITARDAVTRAMAAMEIAESCTHPEIRSSFTNLAETWLNTATQAAQNREGEPQSSEPEPSA